MVALHDLILFIFGHFAFYIINLFLEIRRYLQGMYDGGVVNYILFSFSLYTRSSDDYSSREYRDLRPTFKKQCASTPFLRPVGRIYSYTLTIGSTPLPTS